MLRFIASRDAQRPRTAHAHAHAHKTVGQCHHFSRIVPNNCPLGVTVELVGYASSLKSLTQYTTLRQLDRIDLQELLARFGSGAAGTGDGIRCTGAAMDAGSLEGKRLC